MASAVQGPVERRSDMRKGLLILFGGFAACMALSLWAMHISTPKPAPPPAPPSKLDVPGFPERVEPFASLNRAHHLSVRAEFRGFIAEGVLPDGSVDMTKPGSKIRYAFQSREGLGPQPARKGGTLPSRTYCGKQDVILDEAGIGARKDQAKVHCPSKTPRNLKEPKSCSIKDVFKIAKDRRIRFEGAPIRVEFFEAARGPAYRFTVRNEQKFVVLATDCKTLITGRDQRGSVP